MSYRPYPETRVSPSDFEGIEERPPRFRKRPFAYQENDFRRLEILLTKTRWPPKIMAQILNWHCPYTVNGEMFPFDELIIRNDMLVLRRLALPPLRQWTSLQIVDFVKYYKEIRTNSGVPWQSQILSRIPREKGQNLTNAHVTELLADLWRGGGIRLLYGEKMGPDVRNIETWPVKWVEFFKEHYWNKDLITNAEYMRQTYPSYAWATHSLAAVMAQTMTFRFPPWRWDLSAVEKAILHFEKYPGIVGK